MLLLSVPSVFHFFCVLNHFDWWAPRYAPSWPGASVFGMLLTHWIGPHTDGPAHYTSRAPMCSEISNRFYQQPQGILLTWATTKCYCWNLAEGEAMLTRGGLRISTSVSNAGLASDRSWKRDGWQATCTRRNCTRRVTSPCGIVCTFHIQIVQRLLRVPPYSGIYCIKSPASSLCLHQPYLKNAGNL
jgi:hypothetical protein